VYNGVVRSLCKSSATETHHITPCTRRSSIFAPASSRSDHIGQQQNPAPSSQTQARWHWCRKGLSGRAHVVITTSRYGRKTVEYYQGILQTHRPWQLRPCAYRRSFQQGPKQDVDALVDYIYSTVNLDLDYILPFAAIPKNGLDDKLELAQPRFAGQSSTVTGHVLRDGEPVIEIRSSPPYLGCFSDYENTFQIVNEPGFCRRVE
jgi:hypothetical protein